MAPETGDEEEDWVTRETTSLLWDPQKGLLKQRIDQVLPIYEDLVNRAKVEVSTHHLSGPEPGSPTN
jgi:hypothetical protein